MDDAHFKSAGLREDQTFGYYLMEEQGATCGVFPISEKMRYMVPFRSVEESIQYLQSVATEEGDRCVVLMDDGEKFGGWPDTYHWVYEEGWLEKFLGALEENSSWLTTSTFSQYQSRHSPLGRISLPAGSYSEMGEWALPPEAAEEYGKIRHEVRDRGEMPRYERFLKGGIWRNFLAKYDESNQMHKKMLWVSDKVERARERFSPGRKASPKQKKTLEEAERALYRGQCNCAYWHGVFGGLYLNHLRFGVYRELIESEKLADSLLTPSRNSLSARIEDFNKDGREEIIVEGPGFNAVLEPSSGGSLSELDYLKKPINLSDTLTRRKEAYHSKLLALSGGGDNPDGVASIHDRVKVKEPGLAQKLFYDRDCRVSLTEHFLPPGTTVEQMQKSQYQEWGDFRNNAFNWKTQPPKGKDRNLHIILAREGRLGTPSGDVPVQLTKKLSFSPGLFHLETGYELQNKGSRETRFFFAVEWNLTFLAGDAPDRNYFVTGRGLEQPRLFGVGEEAGVTEAGMTDGWLGLRVLFQASQPAKFWRYPVETISQSEGGFERVYQGSCLLFGWDVSLKANGRFETTLTTLLQEVPAP